MPSATWRRLAALGLLLGAAASARAGFEAEVTHVSDGDTLWVRSVPTAEDPRGRRLKLRLIGLDAPERCQPHGAQARDALKQRVLGRQVVVDVEATDAHGRALSRVVFEGRDVGAALVRDGHAWSARWRDDPGPYAREETEARAARRGLFAAERPELPRDFRRRHGPCP